MPFTNEEIKELEKNIADELNRQPNSNMSTVIKVLTNSFEFEEPLLIDFNSGTVLWGKNDTPVMGLKVIIIADNGYDYDPECLKIKIEEDKYLYEQ